MKVLHLVTQDDQPYGSFRYACERCGEFGRLGNGTHFYTDDRAVFLNPPLEYVACSGVGKWWDPSKGIFRGAEIE